jgi:hypothetical protein
MGSSLAAPAAARALAAYWSANPLASDTADGAHRWWLSPEFGFTPQEVEAALAWLVARGLVLATSGADGRVRYRRNDATAKSDLERLGAFSGDTRPQT